MQTIGEVMQRRFDDSDLDAADAVFDIAESWKDGVYSLSEALVRLRKTRNIPHTSSAPPVAIAALSVASGGSRHGDLMDLLDASVAKAGKKITAFGVVNRWELEDSDAVVRQHFPDRDPLGRKP